MEGKDSKFTVKLFMKMQTVSVAVKTMCPMRFTGKNSCNHITSKHGELETFVHFEKELCHALHHWQSNAPYQQATLDNVSYYIMHSGACDFERASSV